MRMLLKLLAVFQGTGQGQVVGILEVTTHRQAASEAGYFDAEGLQEAADEHRRGLALEVGVGCHDDFFDNAVTQAFEELTYLELLRTDTVHRRYRAVQHVIEAVVGTRTFDGQDV